MELPGRVGTGRADRAGNGRAATGHAGSVPADRAGAGLTDAMYAGADGRSYPAGGCEGGAGTSQSRGRPVRVARVASVGGPDMRGEGMPGG